MPTAAAESMPFTRAAEQINVTQQQSTLSVFTLLHAGVCGCVASSYLGLCMQFHLCCRLDVSLMGI